MNAKKCLLLEHAKNKSTIIPIIVLLQSFFMVMAAAAGCWKTGCFYSKKKAKKVKKSFLSFTQKIAQFFFTRPCPNTIK